MSAPYVIAPSPARCAMPDCTGRNVRTTRVELPNAEPVTVDLCFYCRGAVLDAGGRYAIAPRAA